MRGFSSGTASLVPPGVEGQSDNGTGVIGRSKTREGVVGVSTTGVGVHGQTNSNDGAGVLGFGTGTGAGVLGQSSSGPGVSGISAGGPGVRGFSSGTASLVPPGVEGQSDNGTGVIGRSKTREGVVGVSTTGVGVHGQTNSNDGAGVLGFGNPGPAGIFQGRVDVRGNLTVVNGTKNFKIDHPLDPENKYLLHSCVESPERKNLYDGVARLDEDGVAWVDLPEWFDALNGDFHYQLTAVGGAAPNLHIAQEISENRFKIAGGQRGMKVCWQVTGSRKDPWAAANPFEVEEDKPQKDRGRYLQPDLYDAPEEQRVMIGPDQEKLRQILSQEPAEGRRWGPIALPVQPENKKPEK